MAVDTVKTQILAETVFAAPAGFARTDFNGTASESDRGQAGFSENNHRLV